MYMHFYFLICCCSMGKNVLVVFVCLSALHMIDFDKTVGKR